MVSFYERFYKKLSTFVISCNFNFALAFYFGFYTNIQTEYEKFFLGKILVFFTDFYSTN